jgi:hypothetical protein
MIARFHGCSFCGTLKNRSNDKSDYIRPNPTYEPEKPSFSLLYTFREASANLPLWKPAEGNRKQ